MEYRILLIESSRIMLERLSSVIRGTKDMVLAARYRSPEEALGQGKVFEPNLILLDVEKEESLLAVPRFVKAFPDAALLCLCNSWNAEMDSRVVKAGGRGCLVKPFSGDELLAAVKNLGRSGQGIASDVMAFFSPKGKSGKTTLIANLALTLAQKTGDPVAVIDADWQFGDMAVFFNLTPQSTIVEAVRDIRFLSPFTLNSYFVTVNENLRVLCGTKRPEYAENINPRGFTELLRMVRNQYRYVLIDLPPAFNPLSIAAAEAADTTYLVAMISGGFEVEHMKRALEIFRDWPDYEDRARAVFTRVEPCDPESQRRLATALGYLVEAVLPNEYMLVSSAVNDGRMAIELKPNSPLAQKISQLADRITGRHHIRWDKP